MIFYIKKTGATMANIKNLLIELRAPFLTVTIVPVIAGAVLAHRSGAAFNAQYFVFTLLAFIFLHLGTNVLNDYFDHLNGTDKVNKKFIPPFTGGSRMIQSKALKPVEVLVEGSLLMAAGAAFFIPLILKSGVPMAGVLAFALVAGVFYTAAPFKWAHLGLGEILIFASFGPLMVITSFYIQGGRDFLLPALISIPLGMLTAAIVDINEFPDFEADKKTGKKNLVVRLGVKNGRATYVIMVALAYLVITAAVLLKAAPLPVLAGLITLPLALKATALLIKHYNKPARLAPACGMTILTHLLTGLILIGVLAFYK